MKASLATGGLVLFLLGAGCASSPLEKRLDSAGREFLSKVRYLISRDERRVFLNLPPSEREPFIADFWRSRDPDPATDVNEFKERYFRRIDEANRLFSGGGTPGWLQDRGRIYILIGPPTNRETYPRGITFYGKPVEIWSYGLYTISFVDRDWTGDYWLDPDSAGQLADILSAQKALRPKAPAVSGILEADAEVEERSGGILLRILVPYKTIEFKDDDDRLVTTLRIQATLTSENGKTVWESLKDYDLAIPSQDRNDLLEKDYHLEIPVSLAPGAYALILRVMNTFDESRVFKTIPFKVNRMPSSRFLPGSPPHSEEAQPTVRVTRFEEDDEWI